MPASSTRHIEPLLPAGVPYADSATAVFTFTAGTPATVPGSSIVKTFDSGVTSGVATTTTITVPAAGVALGNTLLIASSKVVTGATDSRGNTYTIDRTQTGAGAAQGASIIRAPITTALLSGDVITLTHANLAGRVAIAIELVGFVASPVDSAGFGTFDVTGASNTSASVTGAGSTTKTNVRIFAVWNLDFSASAPVAGSGYVIEAQQGSSGTVKTLAVEDKTISVDGTQSASLSWTGSSGSQTAILAAYGVQPSYAGESAQFVDPNTATFTFTPSATEVHEIPDTATAVFSFSPTAVETEQTVDADTAAFVLTTSATEVHEIPDVATAAWVMTCSGSEVFSHGSIIDAGTATFTFTASPTGAGTSLLHDIFDRVSSSDVGTATDGTPWVRQTGTSTDITIDGTKMTINCPTGLNRLSQYKVQRPNVDSISTIIIWPSVLTSQNASNWTWGWRVRDQGLSGAGENGYEFRLLLQPTGNIQLIFSRYDNNAVTNLNVGLIVTGGTAGAWTLADTFTAELAMVGTLMYARVWRTAGSKPASPTMLYDTAGDATQYASGPCLTFRSNPVAAPTGTDEAWIVDSIDVINVGETQQTPDTATPAFSFTASATEVHEIPDSATAAWVMTTTAAEAEQTVDSNTATATFLPIPAAQVAFTDLANRTITAGSNVPWGVSDSGHTWIKGSPFDTLTNVSGVDGFNLTNTGVHLTSNIYGQGVLGVCGSGDAEVLFSFSTDQLQSAGGTQCSAGIRATGSANYYAFIGVIGPTTNLSLRIAKRVSSTTTNLGSDLLIAGVGSYNIGDRYWIRGRAEGSTLSAKCWKDGTPEPTTWQKVTTDTDLTSGSHLYMFTGGAGTQTNDVTAIYGEVYVGIIGSDVPVYGDSNTPGFTFTASATETRDAADSQTAAWVMTPGGLEGRGTQDAGTATATFTPSTVEAFASVETATAAYVLTASATEFQSGTGTDAATAAWVMTGSATEAFAGIDAALATFVFTPSTAAESYGTVDAVTAAWVMTTSALEGIILVDSGTAAWVMTTSFSEIFTPATGDVGTAAWVMTTSAVEARTSTDAAQVSYVLTGSATTELHTISDAATSTFVFTASGTDLWIAGESGTGNWVMTAGSTQLFAGVDTATAAYVLTAGAVSEVFGKIDVGTAQWINTASATEGKGYSDSQTVLFFYVAGTPFEFVQADAATALFTFSPSAVEGGSTTEAAICMFNYSVTTVDTYAATDAGLATITFRPSAVEIKKILDYYLEAVQHSRWAATQKHHFDVVQSRRWVTAQNHRWTVTYKGRGLLSG